MMSEWKCKYLILIAFLACESVLYVCWCIGRFAHSFILHFVSSTLYCRRSDAALWTFSSRSFCKINIFFIEELNEFLKVIFEEFLTLFKFNFCYFFNTKSKKFLKHLKSRIFNPFLNPISVFIFK